MIKYKMINSIVVISNIMLLFYLFRCSLSYLSKSVRGFILNNLTWEQNKRREKTMCGQNLSRRRNVSKMVMFRSGYVIIQYPNEPYYPCNKFS